MNDPMQLLAAIPFVCVIVLLFLATLRKEEKPMRFPIVKDGEPMIEIGYGVVNEDGKLEIHFNEGQEVTQAEAFEITLGGLRVVEYVSDGPMTEPKIRRAELILMHAPGGAETD